jgi:hypothetical protein
MSSITGFRYLCWQEAEKITVESRINRALRLIMTEKFFPNITNYFSERVEKKVESGFFGFHCTNALF